MTYRELKNLLNNLTDQELDFPAEVILEDTDGMSYVGTINDIATEVDLGLVEEGGSLFILATVQGE